MNFHKNKAFGFLVIRMITIGLRFLFFALFFKYSETLYGEYSLVATTVTLGVYLLGLDFYMYAGREMLSPHEKPKHIFFHQLIFYGLAYLLLLPFFYLLFRAGFLSIDYILLFYLVLIAEHLSFEIHRLLFTLKEPFWANINLFFRNGFWFIFVLAYYLIFKKISIPVILLFWLAGDILSILCILPVWKKYFSGYGKVRPDWQWIVRGLKTGLPFFAGTLAYKTIEWADRYMIAYFMDKKALGVYAFFGNISTLVNAVVYTAVISILYPILVQKILERNTGEFVDYFRRMKKQVWIFGTVTSILLLVAMPVLLRILKKEIYLDKMPVFYWLVAAQLVLNFSLIYHYVLYGYKKDKILIAGAIWAAFVNVILNLILIPQWGILGAAVATFISFLLLFLYKFIPSGKILDKTII